MYEKTTQDVVEKSSWDAYKEIMQNIGDSRIIFSVHACLGHSNTATTLGYIYNPLTPEESLSIMEKAFAS